MNTTIFNGRSVSSGRDGVYIDGEKIETPKGMRTNFQSVINGHVYVGGYEFIEKEKKFKRTFWAMWHMLFD